MSDKKEEIEGSGLLNLVGVEKIYSTAQTARFFDKTPQWLYWILREGNLTKEDGTPIEPERAPAKNGLGRRRFTLQTIEDIALAGHRRGTISEPQLRTVIRKIILARKDVE